MPISKSVLRGEKRLKALQDTLTPQDGQIPWYDTFNKLTGLKVTINVVDEVPQLGKRDRPSYDLEAEKIVSKVETIEAPDIMEFERRPDGLPMSIKQRFEEPRALKKRDQKVAVKVTE